LPNIVSVLGTLPIFLLLQERFYAWLIPLILYNNIMDDLDGILASKLNLKSQFGAVLDNVCDGVTHTLIVMTIGFHFGDGIAIISIIATAAILLRVVSRLTTPSLAGNGSPTNELIRHLLLLLLVVEYWGFDPIPWLVVLLVLHSISMLATFPMPYMIRSMSKSATAITLVNIALVVAWLIPMTTTMIAACFGLTYLFAFIMGIKRTL
jgi:phosphatidylserine synthase